MKRKPELVLIVLLGCLARLPAQGVVLINEMDLGAVDWCEIVNLGPSPVDIGGWTLQLYDDPTATSIVTFSSPCVLAPNQTMVVSESPTEPAVPAGTLTWLAPPISWAANSGGAAGLVDSQGLGRDLVVFNNGVNLPPGNPASPFTGPLPTAGNFLARISSIDTDSAADWTNMPPTGPTPGLLNPGQVPIAPAQPVAAFTQGNAVPIVGQSVQFIDLSSGLPSSWAWDFDGDGIIDSTVPNPTHVFAQPGVYPVSLTVGNAIGSDTQIAAGGVLVQPPLPAAAPYAIDFSPGSTGPEWLLLPDPLQGNVSIVSSNSPQSGGPALVLASGTSGVVVDNRAVLFVSIGSGAYLDYWYKGLNEGSDPEDGVFLTDGQIIQPVISHAGLGAFWTHLGADLGAIAQAAGFSGSTALQLVFRQKGTEAPPLGGSFIDDLRILGPASGPGQVNGPQSRLEVPGALNAGGWPVADGIGGPFFAHGTTLQLDISGEPSRELLVLFGPLTPGNAFWPGVGTLDLGQPGSFNAIEVLVSGFGASVLDQFAATGPGGQAAYSWDLSGWPPGVVGAFQTILRHSGPSFVAFSAAVEFSVD